MLPALRQLWRSDAFQVIAYGVIAIFIATFLGVDLMARKLRSKSIELARAALRSFRAAARVLADLCIHVIRRRRPTPNPVDLTLVGIGRTAADVSLTSDVAVRAVALARTAADVSLSTDTARIAG